MIRSNGNILQDQCLEEGVTLRQEFPTLGSLPQTDGELAWFILEGAAGTRLELFFLRIGPTISRFLDDPTTKRDDSEARQGGSEEEEEREKAG